MGHPEDSDECDYCRGTGSYLLDGEREACECVLETLDDWKSRALAAEARVKELEHVVGVLTRAVNRNEEP